MMDDAQEDTEIDLIKRLRLAKNEMENTIYAINELSECEKIDDTAWRDFVHDNLPSEEPWNEKISAGVDRLKEMVGSGAHRI